MHRALLIRLGETFEPTFDRLSKIRAPRIQRGEMAIFAAPIVGDGNLSRPVGKLKENVENDLDRTLADLLQLHPDQRDELHLDIYLCANLGERRAVEALIETLESVTALIERDYATVFPAHRKAMERGLRYFPILLMPHFRDSDRPRAEFLAAAREALPLMGALGAADRESPVDRIFLLDAVTSRGVAPFGAMVSQVGTFLLLTTDREIRSSETMLAALDRPCSRRIASFGAAEFDVPLAQMRGVAARLTGEDVLGAIVQLPRNEVPLPTPEELVPSFAVLRDDAMERALEQLEAYPKWVVDSHGISALEAAVADLAEIEKRLGAWRSAGLTRREARDEPSEIATPSDDGMGLRSLGLVGSVVLGTAIWAVAQFAIGLTAALSAGVGLLFAMIGLGMAYFIVSLVKDREEAVEAAVARSPARFESDDLTSEQRLDLLTSAAATARIQGRRLLDSLHELTWAEDEISSVDARPWSWRPSPEKLGQLAHDATKEYATATELAAAFLGDLPPIEDLLRGNATVQRRDLDAFSHSQAFAAGTPEALAHHSVRAELDRELQAFFEAWRHGIDPFIELDRTRNFDGGDVRRSVEDAVFGPVELRAELENQIRDAEGHLHYAGALDSSSVALLTVHCDIDVTSIAAFDNAPNAPD